MLMPQHLLEFGFISSLVNAAIDGQGDLFTRNVDSDNPTGTTGSWMKVERPGIVPTLKNIAATKDGVVVIDEEGNAWWAEHPYKVQGITT